VGFLKNNGWFFLGWVQLHQPWYTDWNIKENSKNYWNSA